MAIAYFIPDQAKLLAASSNTNSGSQTNTNNMSSGTTNHTTSTAGAQTQHTPTTNNTSGAHSHHSGGGGGGGGSVNHSNNFRANITIPLSAYNSATAAHSDVGCWDLLTQIFCHALRFCHQSERHPAVIQISLEISSSGPNGDTTVQVGAAAAPMQQSQQQQEQEHGQPQVQQENSITAHSIAPSLVVHPTALPRSSAYTLESQHNVSAADSSVRPMMTTSPLVASTESTAPAAAAATMSSIDLEPGTHKASAKRNKDNF
ncbi:THAP domain-containing protein 11 [Eurosta solidaginis]|uniref:THAP domain-containing protein 11 n=1 Tax=Eurosta solidaginis TaxID=178769 RepID=UPI003530CE8E